MTAALGPWILRHPDVGNNMEQFILQFVTPEFSSPDAYMRAIVSPVIIFSEVSRSHATQACEVLGTFVKEGLTWSSEEHLNVHFRGIAHAMDDPEFPVRVHAALALTEMIILYPAGTGRVPLIFSALLMFSI